MGFFSKIKQIWSDQSKEKPPAQAQESESEQVTALQEPKQKPEPARGWTQEQQSWQARLRQDLQQAEPRLSVWLDHILEGMDYADQSLWERLEFLLEQLEVPKQEAQDFLARFQGWLQDMEYEHVSEFRSELQYRLALALDLEDEEDEQSRLFLKLSQGLNKTKAQLSQRVDQLLSSSSEFDAAFWEELEEILIMADVGYQTSTRLVGRLQQRVREEKIQDQERFKELFQKELAGMFDSPPKRIKPLPPEVLLMVGVNGVGKTTTIAKLAHRAQMQGRRTLLAAGDTFRAAAIEQLQIWAQRVGAGFYTKAAGSDPAAVAYEALQQAKNEDYDLLIVDTAGRLHTKTDLMDELKKIKRVLGKHHAGAPHSVMLVLDATTGQNAISQCQLFNQGVGVDEVILTKLDGTAKGGVILGIATEIGLPITFVGLGEKMEDLRPFKGEDFARALLQS
ncbi:MAG: signal recognition particle-docking protein FtsY [Desulfohalobiaceae bacterium]